MVLDDDKRIDEAIEAADLAFWAEIAKRFPEAKSGDLSIDRTIALHSVMTEAVEEWVKNNCEEQ